MESTAAFVVSEEDDVEESHQPLFLLDDTDDDVDIGLLLARYKRGSRVSALHSTSDSDLSRYPTPGDPNLLIIRCHVSSRLISSIPLIRFTLHEHSEAGSIRRPSIYWPISCNVNLRQSFQHLHSLHYPVE
jgi:hypothetical protein